MLQTQMIQSTPGGQSVGGQPGPPSAGASIPLSTLIDFTIQRSYHELSVLAELLPRRTDMERSVFGLEH